MTLDGIELTVINVKVDVTGGGSLENLFVSEYTQYMTHIQYLVLQVVKVVMVLLEEVIII